MNSKILIMLKKTWIYNKVLGPFHYFIKNPRTAMTIKYYSSKAKKVADNGDCSVAFPQVYSQDQYETVMNSFAHNDGVAKALPFIRNGKNNINALNISGTCDVCEKKVVFTTFIPNEGEVFNNRENFFCRECGECSRKRMIAKACKMRAEEHKVDDVYILEENSFTNLLRKCFSHVVGSEWMGEKYSSGDVVNGILHEDVSALSFEDNSFDLVVSCDVFEHIFDFRAAFNEIYRILRDDGCCIFSIPFSTDREECYQRALIQNGEIQYLDKAVYHGNPISSEGSLVVWEYGWTLLEEIRSIGFRNVYMQPYCDFAHGHYGIEPPFYFVAEK